MRVHHIINALSPNLCGAEIVAAQLCSGLQARDVDSQLVALVGDPDLCPVEFRSLGIDKEYGLKAFLGVYRYIKDECAADDIIHAHLFPTMLYVSLAVRLLRWKGAAVCTEHSTSNRRRGTLLGSLIDRQVYAGFKKIYCISRGTQDALVKWMPNTAEKTVEIENGAELVFDGFVPRAEHKKLVIASVGRLHKIKNYETALRALSLLDGIDFEYKIAGVGSEEIRLKKLCSELGLDDRVTFCGYVEDVSGFLKAADLFLILSLWEGFGLAAVEAMNAGLPIVAGDVAGLREIIGDGGQCGFLVEPTDAVAIAAAIVELKDSGLRIRLGKSAFKRSLNFSKERMIDGYVAEYARLMTE
jgi:glycosyltransferase involved in cell wall biosynthesis